MTQIHAETDPKRLQQRIKMECHVDKPRHEGLEKSFLQTFANLVPLLFKKFRCSGCAV
jgi:hypothetical protein